MLGTAVQGIPWRGINHQVVYVAPVYIFQELFDQGVLAGAPPYDCIIWILQHEAYMAHTCTQHYVERSA